MSDNQPSDLRKSNQSSAEAAIGWARALPVAPPLPPCDHRWLDLHAFDVGGVGSTCTRCGEWKDA